MVDIIDGYEDVNDVVNRALDASDSSLSAAHTGLDIKPTHRIINNLEKIVLCKTIDPSIKCFVKLNPYHFLPPLSRI
ncbi:MAG TPA: hypothetical protein VEL11_10920 [Candidatus Bathyarchaeia archaeon]|nr:hypothetical protein [Candidatus Bathyarchaeia archaeon]